jgi:arginine/lysine/ornithine decarboxylase
MKYLDESLIAYSKSEVYPFHMPGHKRQPCGLPKPETIDITEIDGFDNLHHAVGILKDAQQRAAELYGSARCFYLVNGSTCGILAAICAATHKRDKVLVARNCHKAVYHAMYLNELQAEYLYPVIARNGVQGQISVSQVEASLQQNADIAAVIITSPTYEGVISNIRGISEVCHRYGVPLIVDEAHGAHLGLGGNFPENAVRQGADAIIMSMHKTLPSLTQTALLHLTSERMDAEEVARYLGIYETSSPSYLLMGGMDACVRTLKEQGGKLFSDYQRKLSDFYSRVSDLKSLHVMTAADFTEEEAFCVDASKIVIFAGEQRTGKELYRILLEKYRLQMEMVSGDYVLGMTSIMDTQEGYDRLLTALHEIDGAFCSDRPHLAKGQASEAQSVEANSFVRSIYVPNPREMHIYQALAFPYKEVPLDEAVGAMAADYVYLYPPGIPLIMPGEIITTAFVEHIRQCIRLGLDVQGITETDLFRIKIVYF